MDLDLATFLVALYVIVDDLYQSHITPRMPACGGPEAQMSDSEVLCVALAVQWARGPMAKASAVSGVCAKHPGICSAGSPRVPSNGA